MPATAPNSADCLFYLKLESDATDSTSNGIDFTDSVTGYSTGILNNGASLDGVNDKIVYTSMDTKATSTDYSISMWAQSDVGQGNGDYNLLYRWTTSTGTIDCSRCYWSGYGANNMRFRVNTDAGTVDINYAAAIGTGWHHYVFVVDNTNSIARVYVDGSQVASGALSGTPIISSSDFCIGNRNFSTGEGWDGIIDEVAYFEVALTTDNITYLYNSGAPGTAQQYPFSSGGSYLISSINGVDPANISTINGVAIANIASWNGTNIQ